MVFNVKKCFIMHITLATKNKSTYTYKMAEENLISTKSSTYLGVTINSDLRWNAHIDKIVKKANNVLNFIKRNLKKCPRHIKEKAYLTYVRPQLEYSTTIWDPHTKANIEKIEKVQRRAARFVKHNYQQKASVTEMIKSLQWQTLQQRRTYAGLVMFFRIAHGFIAVPATILPPMAQTAHNTRHNHHLCFLQPQCRINAYSTSFVPRMIPIWNTLPSIVVSCTTTESFKEKLEEAIYN